MDDNTCINWIRKNILGSWNLVFNQFMIIEKAQMYQLESYDQIDLPSSVTFWGTLFSLPVTKSRLICAGVSASWNIHTLPSWPCSDLGSPHSISCSPACTMPTMESWVSVVGRDDGSRNGKRREGEDWLTTGSSIWIDELGRGMGHPIWQDTKGYRVEKMKKNE